MTGDPGHAGSEDASPPTITSTELLQGLRDPANQTAWRLYVERYRPLIVRVATRRGLTRDDAEDAAQASLLDFSKEYLAGRYDRERGRLRHWLFGIVHNRIRSTRRLAENRARQPPGGPSSADALAAVPAADGLEELWEAEWRDAVLRQCLDEVRREVKPETFEAFRRYTVLGEEAEDVARDLGLTVNAVYGAKRRVLARLRELEPVMESIW